MPTALLDLSILRTNARTRGIGRYVADLALSLTRLARRSDNFRLLGVQNIGLLGDATITDDVAGAVQRLLAPDRATLSHANWAYRLRLGLARAVRATAPDLLHCGHPGATPLGQINCPRITTCHDLIPLHYPQHYLTWRDGYRSGRERLDHRRFHSADHVICVSETSANDLNTLLGVPRSKITVVYNGVDLGQWTSEPQAVDSEVRERHGLSQSNYILCVGAANWRKNPLGILDALVLARNKMPDQELLLVWAARLGAEAVRFLEHAAQERNISQAVHLLGWVSDQELSALYRGAVAQVFVSRAEGFGYPAVEAMATGCPVITSDRSSMAEIVGDAALQVDPESPAAIAHAIELAMASTKRRSYSERGVARAKRFSLNHMADNTLAVYRKVLGESRNATLAASRL